MENLNIITLNINGLNTKSKQLKLIDLIKFHRLDIIMIQEHNVHDKSKLCKELSDVCHIYLNLAINLKGGTAILVNKKLNCKFISVEMSADSRITSLKLSIYKQTLQIVNIYADSGSNTTERENMFQNELLFYFSGGLELCPVTQRHRI